MSRAMRWFVLALLATPVAAVLIHRLAKGLGFLDPPADRQHELRRTILVALFAFVLFFSVFLFGYANAWPRVWAVFGIINAVALVVFATLGILAARQLWRLRHPQPEERPAAGEAREGEAHAAEKPLV